MKGLCIGLLLGLASPAARLGAQIAFDGSGTISLAEHRVDPGFGSGVERNSGPVFGAGVGLEIGSRWHAGLRAAGGTLTSNNGGFDQTLDQVSADVAFHVTTGIDVESSVRRRMYQDDLARQGWTTIGLGGAGRIPFFGGNATGIIRGALFPYVSVAGLSAPSLAFAAGAGMVYRRGAVNLALLYGIERYDFSPSGGPERQEQLSTLTFRLELHPGPAVSSR